MRKYSGTEAIILTRKTSGMKIIDHCQTFENGKRKDLRLDKVHAWLNESS